MSAAPRDGLDGEAREAWLELFGPWIAHRGLWSPDGRPENSLAAFKAAAEAGFGVELDVRLSADGDAMVFHDATLARMTGEPGALADRKALDLGTLQLGGGAETVPTLEQALRVVAGRTLVLIELKTEHGEEGPLEARVVEVVERIPGLHAAISFNSRALARVAALRPGMLRGLNSYAYDDARSVGLSADQRRSMASFDHLPGSQAHFVLPGLDILPSAAVEDLRGEGTPVVAWTSRSPEQHEAAEPLADNMIFEGYRP